MGFIYTIIEKVVNQDGFDDVRKVLLKIQIFNKITD